MTARARVSRRHTQSWPPPEPARKSEALAFSSRFEHDPHRDFALKQPPLCAAASELGMACMQQLTPHHRQLEAIGGLPAESHVEFLITREVRRPQLSNRAEESVEL